MVVIYLEREECAFSIEKSLIRFYGKENLCNMTDGGDGVSGLTGPKNHKYNNDKIKYWHDDHGYKECTQNELSTEFGIHHSKVSEVTRGIRLSCDGWVLMCNKGTPIGSAYHCGHRHKNYDHTQYNFIHKDGRKFSGTKFQFREMSGAHSSSVYNLLSGKYKFCKGWRLDDGTDYQEYTRFFRGNVVSVKKDGVEVTGTVSYVCDVTGLNKKSLGVVLKRGKSKHRGWEISYVRD